MKLTLQTGEVINNPSPSEIRQSLLRLDPEECLFLVLEKSETERLRAFHEEGSYRLDYQDSGMGRAMYSEPVELNVAHFVASKFAALDRDWFESLEWRNGLIEITEHVRGWLYFFCLWPLYLLIIGGALGGAVGGLAAASNFVIMRNPNIDYNLRLFLVGISGIWAFFLYLIIAIPVLIILDMIFGGVL